ncbi:aspartate/glutamate racemase family protein [Parafrankia sp. EUN1f]|uniref:aspartate/glutamate racemase family protein n=1 Tax=Parafrankia sp. EUN1f TaxID=102897 RepID=UPI0001C45326|nr:aspartate/glutamate racemase family protein [Parafrankia sp. EUN1f]EFC78954.1 aspartate racemase [Parafrankia sp. EUN1f]
MKLIGLLGGMSWESTDYYYQQLNRQVRDRLRGLHSARCLIYSVDFADIEEMQRAGSWDAAANYLARCAAKLQDGGAECIVLCTNTMHRVFDSLAAETDVPVLHIADGTAASLRAAGVEVAALLGTQYTMEQDFYKGRLEQQGVKVVVPDADSRKIVHDIIYDELCRGKVVDSSREKYVKIVDDLAGKGAQAVIFGCTEIGLLLSQSDCSIPVFDTTLIHVETALEWAMG